MKEKPRLIQYCVEFRPKEEVESLPVIPNFRGIYVLFQKNGKSRDVVYVGVAAKDTPGTSIRSRLLSHATDKNKKNWTHFSFYRVWPNITEQEIKELEGLFLHIYRKDKKAQRFNKAKHFRPLVQVRITDIIKHKNNLVNLERITRRIPFRGKKGKIKFSL